MRIGDYLQKIYEPDGVTVFHNIPNFVEKLFSAAGSDRYDSNCYTKGSLGGDYAYKIYGGNRRLSGKIKKSFHKINKEGLIIFFEKYFQKEHMIREKMSNFGISNTEEINRICFFSALASQFELFITTDVDDIDDIVARMYKTLTEPKTPSSQQLINKQTNTREKYRYSLIIYEDDMNVRKKLKQYIGGINCNENTKYFVDILDANIATTIIEESIASHFDAYIIDISRPSTNTQNGGYTDYSYSGKDLFEELLRIKVNKVKESKQLFSVFFIYSTMASDELRNIFEYTDATYLCKLTAGQ